RKENLAFGDLLHSASRAGVGVAYDRVRRRLTRGGFIPGRYSQSRYPEVKHWLPAPGNSAGRFAVSSTYLPNHRRSNMMTFLSALDEEGFLTYEVSDD